MKNFKVILFLTLFVAFSFTSCSSDSSNGEENSGNSTGDYWPTAINNSWVYSANKKESTMKIIGIDEIDGNKYYKFDQLTGFGDLASGKASIWLKKNKGDYYIKIGDIEVNAGEFVGKVSGYEFLLFKDYLEVKGTWGGTYTHTIKYNIPNFPNITTKGTYAGEILEKDTSLTVNGLLFKDVIKFSFSQNASIDGGKETNVKTIYWIAKNVGIIKMDNDGALTELKSRVLN